MSVSGLWVDFGLGHGAGDDAGEDGADGLEEGLGESAKYGFLLDLWWALLVDGFAEDFEAGADVAEGLVAGLFVAVFGGHDHPAGDEAGGGSGPGGGPGVGAEPLLDVAGVLEGLSHLGPDA